MRKLFLILAGIAAMSISANAEDTIICGFEDGETGYQLGTEWASGYTWGIVDNTDNTGINISDKCMMCTAEGALDSWGCWFTIVLDQPIVINESNRYLKFMMKRTPNNVNISVACKNDQRDDPRGYLGMTKPLREGEWGDVVFDLFNNGGEKSFENQEITKIFISHFGTWEGIEPGVCFIDNVVLSDNAKPRGAKEIKAGLIANFEDDELTAANFASIFTQSAESKYEVVGNPLKDELNGSEKCLSYYKPANTTWWHSGMITVNGIIPVEYPASYLHVMAYIPDASAFVATVKDISGKSYQEVIYPESAGWADYVLDVSELSYISGLEMRFNYNGTEEDWENEAGNYYVDDIALTSDSEPRTSVESGIAAIDASTVVSVNGNVVTVSGLVNNVTVYNLAGMQIASKAGAATFTLGDGLFFVKVVAADGAVNVSKVLVR